MRLGVNVDHVATVRQARRGLRPDPIEAATTCERSGADSIVWHLREDRRHIQDADVARLLAAVRIPVNLELSLAPDIIRAALRLQPNHVTVVPERRQELTTEGGLDVVRLSRRIRRAVERFHEKDIGVSLFIDPAAVQLEAAARCGVRRRRRSCP